MDVRHSPAHVRTARGQCHRNHHGEILGNGTHLHERRRGSPDDAKKARKGDFADYVELVHSSGVRAEVMAATDFFEFQDGVSRAKLELLFREGLCPKFRDVRVLEVRRGSEMINLKTSHQQKQFERYALIKTTHHPSDIVAGRQRARGVNREKIDGICRALLPLMPAHSAVFWRRLQTEEARNVGDLLV